MRLAMVGVGVVLFSLGCGEPKSAADYVGDLQSADAGERRSAADDLRDDDGPPPEALPYLYAAIDREQNPGAYGAMMITLGASGDPRAHPYICSRVYDPDARMRRWAQTALKLWLPKNRQSPGCPPPSTAIPAPGALPPPPPSVLEVPPPPPPPPPPPQQQQGI